MPYMTLPLVIVTIMAMLQTHVTTGMASKLLFYLGGKHLCKKPTAVVHFWLKVSTAFMLLCDLLCNAEVEAP